MKFTIFLIVLGICQVKGTTWGQEISLSVENAPLQEVFQEIRKQSGYDFIYTTELIKQSRPVTLHVSGLSVSKVLDLCLANQPFTYILDHKTIIFRKKIQVKIVEQLSQKTYLPTLNIIPTDTLRGVVHDENGETLIGVNVQVKGTNKGTATDFLGRFELVNVAEDGVLVFSYIGYKMQEVAVNGRSVINIEMQSDAAMLDEVVVIGYGTMKKSDLTGSVSQIKAEDYASQNTTNFVEMMSGTIAGVNSNQNYSASGGGSLEIRGATSLAAGNDPLIVLDGVIFNGNLNEIAPSDIATIDILKDASSTAVFGAKAAAGVILITTKKGKEGKPSISFSAMTGYKEPSRKFNTLNAEEYLKFRRDYFRSNDPKEPYFYYNPNELPGNISIDEWRNYSQNPADDNINEWTSRLRLEEIEKKNYMAGKSVDWYREVINPSVSQNYNLSLSGNTNSLSYYWSLGYVDENGIIQGDGFKSVRTRLNLEAKINEVLSVGVNSHFSDNDLTSVPADFNQLYRVTPLSQIYADDGLIKKYPNDVSGVINPLLNTKLQKAYNKSYSLFSTMYTNLKLPYGFNFKFSATNRYQFRKDHNYFPSTTTTGGDDHVRGYGFRSDNMTYEYQIDNLLTWDRTYNIHDFNFTFLYNVEQIKGWKSYQSNEDFNPNENLIYHALQFGSFPILENDDSKATGDALMARLNYSLAKKYLLTLSFRRDGYSAFGRKNSRANFPAMAFGWRFSQEDFMKDMDWLDNGKLRFSWGVNGNRDIGVYSALARLGSYRYISGSETVVGVFNSTLANPNLRWERTEAYNMGLDADIYKGRLSFSADAYLMKTNDLLLTRTLPTITGYGSMITNLGELENKGFEFSLNTVNIDNKRSFMWRSSLVYSMNRNKINELWGDVQEEVVNGETILVPVNDYSNEWFVGQSIDRIWDYDVVGVWQENEVDEAAVYGLKPGDFKAVDQNNDGKYTELKDKTFLGYKKPQYRLGFRNDIRFLKNWEASIFVKADLDFYGTNAYYRHARSNSYDNSSTFPLPYWTPENPSNEYARLNVNTSVYDGGLGIWKNRSYARIQDASLTYIVPNQQSLARFGIKNLKIYLSARNLYSFDSWDLADPESGLNPMPRTYSLGVDINL